MSDHKCPRCGAPLKVETVQVPIYSHYLVEEHTKPIRGEVQGYEDREEVSDCVRCTGSY